MVRGREENAGIEREAARRQPHVLRRLQRRRSRHHARPGPAGSCAGTGRPAWRSPGHGCSARARAQDEHATWAELLSRALDYRYWHRFAIERQQDGQWRSATGPASGGERVLTVSVPLFAAASAHYRSAHPHAPRLIMLDEAFAGVDDSARGQFLGLLAAFDLDVAMTSEREWGFTPACRALRLIIWCAATASTRCT